MAQRRIELLDSLINSSASIDQLNIKLKVSIRTIEKDLAFLKENNLIEFNGAKKNSSYKIKNHD